MIWYCISTFLDHFYLNIAMLYLCYVFSVFWRHDILAGTMWTSHNRPIHWETWMDSLLYPQFRQTTPFLSICVEPLNENMVFCCEDAMFIVNQILFIET